jgi:hypothetical protein
MITGGAGGGTNCAMVGCAMPPLCVTGCTEVCGCCPCGDGTTETRNGILYVCTGGCYAPSVDAGTCDPAKETHQRNYVATSPAQCMAVRFACAANTTMFQNACGCGCEQDPSCPDWFDCMPPAPCDEQQIHAKCPFSGIAY